MVLDCTMEAGKLRVANFVEYYLVMFDIFISRSGFQRSREGVTKN